MSLQQLLRLPACLRQASLLQGTLPKTSTAQSSRFFSTSIRPQARFKPKTPATRPPLLKSQLQRSRSPKPTPPTPSTHAYRTFTDRFADLPDPFLIYRAPRHGSFILASYIVASLFMFYAYTWTKIIVDGGQKIKTWVFCASLGMSCIILGFMTAFALAPARLIKTIHIIPRSQVSEALRRFQGPILRFQPESPLPLMKSRHFDVAAGECYMDRHVRADDLEMINIPLPGAPGELHRATMPQKSSFSESMLNIWPTTKRNCKKMIMRAGIMYIRVPERGNWKVDLERCQMMDYGQVLNKLVKEDFAVRDSILSMLRRNVLGH